MSNLLDQLHKTKLQLIAVLATVGGIACLLLAHWSSEAIELAWVQGLPISEIGSTLFSTGLLAIFFEYVDRKHGDERADQRVRDAVRNEAPAIRDAVLDSFAFNPEGLKSVASDDTLDRIAANALGLRLNEPSLATDIYRDIRDQVIRAPERWHDLDVAVELVPWSGGPTAGHGSMFVATIRWEYRVRPHDSTIRFACVSNDAEYRELLHDRATTAVWYFEPSGGVTASSRDAFELVQLTIDGKPRSIRRTERKGAQLYSAYLGKIVPDDGDVVISYSCRVLVQRHSHMLTIDVPQLTKGVKISFRYDRADIRHVNVLDYIGGLEQARVTRAPNTVPAPSVQVAYDDWVLARSGVAFVWVLDGELPAR